MSEHTPTPKTKASAAVRVRQLQYASHAAQKKLTEQIQQSQPESVTQSAEANNDAVHSVENAMSTGSIYIQKTAVFAGKAALFGARRIIQIRQRAKMRKNAPPVWERGGAPPVGMLLLQENTASMLQLPEPLEMTRDNAIETRLKMLRSENLNPVVMKKYRPRPDRDITTSTADAVKPYQKDKSLKASEAPVNTNREKIKDTINPPGSKSPDKRAGGIGNYSRKKENALKSEGRMKNPRSASINTGSASSPASKEAKSRFMKKSQKRKVLQNEAKSQARVGLFDKIRNAISEVLKRVKSSPKTALAAAGVVVISVLLVGAATSVVGSPFGMFYSEEDNSEETMSIAAVVAQINGDYNIKLEEIKASNSHDSVQIHGTHADFVEVVAVWSVRTTTRQDEFAMDVVTIDQQRADLMKEVFWDMTTISTRIEKKTRQYETVNNAGEIVTVTTTERILHITVSAKAYGDMPDYYGFNASQAELLEDVMEQRALIQSLLGDYQSHDVAASIAMSDDDLFALAASYGVTLDKELSIERKNVLKAAFVGVQVNIPYHYNWRSVSGVYPGLEGNDFGSTVPADYKGRTRKGLDCSGYVGWAFHSAGITWTGFGYGESGGRWYYYATPAMRSASSTSQISAAQLKPGDIGFLSNSAAGTSDHTGIYLGTTSAGRRLWLHCGGSTGTVCSSPDFAVFYTVSGMDQTFGWQYGSGDLSAQEIEWLAALIYYEARGMNSYCKELVATVAMNRVHSQNYDFRNVNTLEAVLKQPGQYGYGNPNLTATKIFNGSWRNEPEARSNPAVVDACFAAAMKVANGTSRDENGNPWPSDVLFQHSFPNPNALGTGHFKSYSSGGYTEHFNYG